MEGFLSRGASINSVVDEEFILSRYHNIDYIMAFDYEYGIDFIHQAYDKSLEERLFQQWLVELPNMKKSLSFEAYKKERLRPRIKIEKRFSKEEWLSKAEEIEERAKRGDS